MATLYERGEAILVECGARIGSMCGCWLEPVGILDSDGLPANVSTAVQAAARRLAKGDVESLLDGYRLIDSDFSFRQRSFSNLAARDADAEDYAVCRGRGLLGKELKEAAEKRHQERTLAALDDMMAPEAVGVAVEKRIRAALEAAGIDVAKELRYVGDVRRITDRIQMLRIYRAVAGRMARQAKTPTTAVAVSPPPPEPREADRWAIAAARAFLSGREVKSHARVDWYGETARVVIDHFPTVAVDATKGVRWATNNPEAAAELERAKSGCPSWMVALVS